MSDDHPIILISSCVDSHHTGDDIYNGGVKLYNLWVKLLRNLGLQAYVVTYDGLYRPWLIEHQPHVSLDTVRRWQQAGLPIRFVTGWLGANAWLELADSLYYYDCEIAHTIRHFQPRLQALFDQQKITGLATNSRHQQAWYLANYQRLPILIPEWSDTTRWKPDPTRRISQRVGYCVESRHTRKEIEVIKSKVIDAGLQAHFIEIAGREDRMLELLQTCDIFLAMNPGKHPLWGEGCPRTPQEAMHAGCVVIAYNVQGNREYIHSGYTGLCCSTDDRPQAMARHLISLLTCSATRETIRQRSTNYIQTSHGAQAQLHPVLEFLRINSTKLLISPASHPPADISKSDIQKHLKQHTYIGEDEVPLFIKYARQASQCIVEIGAGYGSSAALFCAYAPSEVPVHSIDPFVRDSMGSFQGSARTCRANILTLLREIGHPHGINRWTLHIESSQDAAHHWRLPMDILFLDGDHQESAVFRDFDDWFPWLTTGGILMIHDSRRLPGAPAHEFNRGWQGPTQLATSLLHHDQLELIDEAFSLTVWRKR